MFQRVLICTDFTDGLYRLTRFVPSLAESGLTKIVFLHTAPLAEGAVPRPDTEAVETARNRLSQALENVPPGVEVHLEVKSGRPIDHIPDTIDHHQVDLMILGTPGRNLLTEKLFGSTTMNLCQRTKIPIMILRPQLISAYTEEELMLRCRHLFCHFMIPFDGSESSEYTVEQIKQRMQQHPNSLEACFLCWVVDEVSRNKELRKNEQAKAEETLARVKQDLEALGLRVKTEVRVGNPVVELQEAAVDEDISAIASASRNVGKLIELSVPSLTGELLRKSWHPVLYFPILRS